MFHYKKWSLISLSLVLLIVTTFYFYRNSALAVAGDILFSGRPSLCPILVNAIYQEDDMSGYRV